MEDLLCIYIEFQDKFYYPLTDMSDNEEPINSEQYIAKVLKQSENMQREHIPSHRELIKQY